MRDESLNPDQSHNRSSSEKIAGATPSSSFDSVAPGVADESKPYVPNFTMLSSTGKPIKAPLETFISGTAKAKGGLIGSLLKKIF